MTYPHAASIVLLAASLAAATVQAEAVAFIRDGKPLLIRALGDEWAAADGAVRGSGTRTVLLAGRAIGGGDFHIRARLRILKLRRSAASFVIDRRSHFGFEGATGQTFLTGPLFRTRGGRPRFLGPSSRFLKGDAWMLFEVVRKGDQVRFLINGKDVTQARFAGKRFGSIGFSPWRSTMEISDFSATGETADLPKMMPRHYTIPTIDLAGETHRQVVVDREAGQYLGHPTTVLLEDNRTMIAVYPKGHGRGAIVMKRSTDGGLTWSKRLPVPENWATSLEVPTLYRVADPKGVKRLIMFSGLYPIRMAVSEDDGATWSPLRPIGGFGGIVAMADLVRLSDGSLMALFHDDGRFLKKGGKRTGRFRVYKTLSTDGGLTWGSPEVIAEHPTAHLCEPGAVRSPDGKQLALLLRENSRQLNSFVIFSYDEGKTWSAPHELPAALTGDRHQCRYAPDGRLVISFRDTTHVSPTKGDWVLWIGRYDDILKGREGQYRVRLMDNHRGGDCAYPALELLPDGTFVATTYGHWIEGEKPFIASVRFKLDEIDAKAAKLGKKKP